MAAILKLQCYIGNPTLPIDAYLLEEQSCQISSRSCLKRRSLTFFEEIAPTRRTKTTGGMRPVPDLNKSCCFLVRARQH